MPEYKWFYLCFLSLGLHLEGLCFADSLCCHFSSTKYKENAISSSLEAELSIQHIRLLVQNQQCLSQMLSKQWEMKNQLRIRKCLVSFQYMKYYKTHPWIVSYKYQEKLKNSVRDFYFSRCDPDCFCVDKNHTLIPSSSCIYMSFQGWSDSV